MTINRGKQFEERFKKDWESTFPKSFLTRLPDQVSGYKGSRNICDFIGYTHDKLFLLECKTHKGLSIPFSAISQHETLVKYVGLPGVRAGVVL